MNEPSHMQPLAAKPRRRWRWLLLAASVGAIVIGALALTLPSIDHTSGDGPEDVAQQLLEKDPPAQLELPEPMSADEPVFASAPPEQMSHNDLRLVGYARADLKECRPDPELLPSGSGYTGGVDVVAADVERLRELRFEEPPEVTFLSREELAERLRKGGSASDFQEAILKNRGLVPDDFDLDEYLDEAV